MNDNSEAHNLGKILRLLHLAPVTFRPGLPCMKIGGIAFLLTIPNVFTI